MKPEDTQETDDTAADYQAPAIEDVNDGTAPLAAVPGDVSFFENPT